MLMVSPLVHWISTHALREEGHMIIAHPPCTYLTFLPTPSARRATRTSPHEPRNTD